MNSKRCICKLDKRVVLLLINYIAHEVTQLCKENYSNCLWRKTDWALNLAKLGKATKISGDLRRSLEIVTSLRKSWEVWSGDLRKSSEVLRQSSEVLEWSLEIFGDVQVIFGKLRKCSRDLWKSLEVFGWSSEILEVFGGSSEILRSVRVICGNPRKVSCGLW